MKSKYHLPVFALLIALVLQIVFPAGITVKADGEYYEGVRIGTDIYYTYDADTKVLTISGSGNVYSNFKHYDYLSSGYYFSEEILINAETLVFENYNSNEMPDIVRFLSLERISVPDTYKGRIRIDKCGKLINLTCKNATEYSINECPELLDFEITPLKDKKATRSYQISKCNKIENLVFDDDVSEVNIDISNCENLINISLPKVNGLKVDDEYYIYSWNRISVNDCPKIKEIEWPKNVNVGGFQNCPSLEKVIIPAPDAMSYYGLSIDPHAFERSNKVVIYGYENTEVEKFAKSHFIPFVSLGVYTPPKDDNNPGQWYPGGGTGGNTTSESTDTTTENNKPVVNTTTNQNLAETVKNAEKDAVIKATVTGDGSVKSDVFNAIKGTDKTVTFTTGNVEWTFEGKDIIRDAKDINVTAEVKIDSAVTGEAGEAIGELTKGNNTLVVSFPENGTLPGMARIRVRLDSAMQNHLASDGLYVYFYDNKTGKPELIARNIAVDKAGYVEFSINHCSDYLITSKPIEGVGENPVYRLFNPKNGDHLLTTAVLEKEALEKRGWKYEDVAMTTAEAGGDPVYRLFNVKSGLHHYTQSENEMEILTNGNWKLEGIVWYSASFDEKDVYRLFNLKTGAHHFTVNSVEKEWLEKNGWKSEGVAFKAI